VLGFGLAVGLSYVYASVTLLVNATNALDGHLASDSGRGERRWLLCEAMLSYALGNAMASTEPTASCVSGFTDAAHAIATAVGTWVLSPQAAVVVAGMCNLIGGLTGTAVALTIGTGLVDPGVLSLVTVVAALASAMFWSLLTYVFGIRVSEIRGLIGGLIDVAVATAGLGVVQ